MASRLRLLAERPRHFSTVDHQKFARVEVVHTDVGTGDFDVYHWICDVYEEVGADLHVPTGVS